MHTISGINKVGAKKLANADIEQHKEAPAAVSWHAHRCPGQLMQGGGWTIGLPPCFWLLTSAWHLLRYHMQDLLNALLGLRISPAVVQWEREVNRRFWLADDDSHLEEPWVLSAASKTRLTTVLHMLADKLPARVAGLRFKNMLDVKKKKRLAHYYLLRGPIGEELTTGARIDTWSLPYLHTPCTSSLQLQ
jgi:hypothetical protein